MSATSSSLRAEPLFVRWASAEGVSMLGSAVTAVVLPLVVYEITGSAAQTGALFAMRVVPYLLSARRRADRRRGNRRRLIIGGNLLEGLLVATIPIAHVSRRVDRRPDLPGRVAVRDGVRVLGCGRVRRGAGARRPERLPPRTGCCRAWRRRRIAGPVIAGVLVRRSARTTPIWIDAASFFVAAAVQSSIRSTFRRCRRPAAADDLRPAASRHCVHPRRPTVATLLVAGFGNSFAFGTVLGLLVPYAVEELGVTPTTAGSACSTVRSASAA